MISKSRSSKDSTVSIVRRRVEVHTLIDELSPSVPKLSSVRRWRADTVCSIALVVDIELGGAEFVDKESGDDPACCCCSCV